MSLLQGIMLGAGLCGSLGPQSVFVLRQGIRGEMVLQVALICTLVDFAMIIAAVAGADAFILLLPNSASAASLGAAAFILAYAGFLFATAFRKHTPFEIGPVASKFRTPAVVIALTLALSLLNPQVYLEMIVMVGGVSLHFPNHERWFFALGVALASPLWFFGLALSGRWVARLLVRPGAVMLVDVGSGLVMVLLALAIIVRELGWL